jgi:hypothetical protein
MKGGIQVTSVLTQARIAGFFWMVCVAAGIYGAFLARGTHMGQVSLVVAGAAYLVVTVVLYVLLKPVDATLAALAAAFGIVGTATSSDSSYFFGFQCILIGYLVLRSTFLPRVLGALMVLAGIGQVVFVSTLLPSPLHAKLAPIGYVSDAVGEIALALWLLIFGINVARWQTASQRTKP